MWLVKLLESLDFFKLLSLFENEKPIDYLSRIYFKFPLVFLY